MLPSDFAASMTMDESPYPTPTVRRRSLFDPEPRRTSDSSIELTVASFAYAEFDSELVEFDDLGVLDSHDLRAVLDEVSEPQVLEALGATNLSFRRQLLNKLSTASATRLEAQLGERGPIDPEAAQTAQRRAGRSPLPAQPGGLVAFDVPEDMVA